MIWIVVLIVLLIFINYAPEFLESLFKNIMYIFVGGCMILILVLARSHG